MYTIAEISILIGAHRIGTYEQQIAWLLTDSRSLSFPESSLFFAIRTAKGDGHAYIKDLYDRGVRAFVVEEVPAGDYADANFLLVPNTLQALQRLAERHRDSFSIPVLGITGSNGKTIVKEWLYQMLSPDCTVTRSPRSYNSQIGVPLSVWGLWEKSQVGIFEAAISQPGGDGCLAKDYTADAGNLYLSGYCPSGELRDDGAEVYGEAAPLQGCQGADIPF